YLSPLVFFPSRRRHTRSKRDWSSDVCSSDLRAMKGSLEPAQLERAREHVRSSVEQAQAFTEQHLAQAVAAGGRGYAAGEMNVERSEERRVGKEGEAERQRYARRIGGNRIGAD